MKYAIRYTSRFRYLNEVDEILLPYSGSDTLMTFVPELVGENKSQRIVLELVSIEDDKIPDIIPFIAKLKKDGYNMTVKLNNNLDIINLFKDAGIPFFFNLHCSRLETAYFQCEIGVSDLYITEELGFRLKDISYLKSKYNVNIRVLPNIAQSANNHHISGMERFWIRPEDTEIYEPYVDVFELVSGSDTSRLSVVYEIYRDRQWLGNLNDIILDLKESIINNRGMNPHFAEMRLNCGKKCILDQCNLCKQIGTLSNSLVEVGIEAVKKKYKPERTKEEQEEIINKLKERAHELGFNEDIDHIK